MQLLNVIQLLENSNNDSNILENITWYHGTSTENWDKIQQSGYLGSMRKWYDPTFPPMIDHPFTMVQQTFLTNDINEARQFKTNNGEQRVILAINYPFKQSHLFHSKITTNMIKRLTNNQRVIITVAIKIPLQNIKIIE